MAGILALKEGYTPEQIQGLASYYLDSVSRYHPETSEFCEVLKLRRGVKY